MGCGTQAELKSPTAVQPKIVSGYAIIGWKAVPSRPDRSYPEN